MYFGSLSILKSSDPPWSISIKEFIYPKKNQREKKCRVYNSSLLYVIVTVTNFHSVCMLRNDSLLNNLYLTKLLCVLQIIIIKWFSIILFDDTLPYDTENELWFHLKNICFTDYPSYCLFDWYNKKTFLCTLFPDNNQ